MNRLSKFAAALLAVLLVATPLIAATPCFGIAHSTPDCSQCCDEMSASMGMATVEAMMGSVQDQLSEVTCCGATTSETASLAMSQEPQGPVTRAADRAVESFCSTFFASVPSQRLQPPPDRSKSDRVYSDLCTFRI